MKNLINKYPIQIFTERLLVNNEQELQSYLKQYNTKKTFYYSLYSPHIKETESNCCDILINNYHFCNTKIDKIVFDIDNLNALSTVKKLHLYLLKNKLKHYILFSGMKGFHLYIYTKNYDLIQNPKQSLINAHNFFIQELNFKKDDIDFHILGDVARLMRLPNTMHISSNLFCIPITTEDLILGKSHILNKAKKQNFSFVYYGTNYFNIINFDNKLETAINHKSNINIKIDINVEKILQESEMCIKIMLSGEYVFWRQRFFIIKNLQSKGYIFSEIDCILYKILSGKKHPYKGHDNYEHMRKERQIEYVLRNPSLFSCKQIKQEAMCPIQLGLCKQITNNPVYYNGNGNW